MTTIAHMTPEQLATIKGFQSTQNWPGMYKYIADGIANNSIQVPGGTDSKIYFWYSQASAVNANDGTSPGTAFIRGVAATGMQYGTNGSDGTAPAPGFLNEVSNKIAGRVADEILDGKGLPDFKTQLSNDISVSFEMGISFGGWGGSFYHWNDIYVDPKSGAEKTVGEWIASKPGEYEKFVSVNAKTVADLAQQVGDFTQDGSGAAFLGSLQQAGLNAATDPLGTGFDAGIAYNQIVGRALLTLTARGYGEIADAVGNTLGLQPSDSSSGALSNTDALGNYIPGSESPGSAGASSPATPNYNFPDTAGGGRGNVNPDVVVPVAPRPASSTFVTTVDPTHVTLSPGGTVSDIVAEQRKAGNPITADDVRAANPDLNINVGFTNVPAGASLQVPVRVGDNLVTTLPDGSTQSVNTKTNEVLTVVHNADGSTTQTTSSTDGEFTRTVRTVTWDQNEQVTSEERYNLNTLDNTKTPLNTDGTPVTPAVGTPDTTDAATQQIIDAFSNPVVISTENDVQLADASSVTGTGTVSDAGSGISLSTDNGSTSNQPVSLVESEQPATNTVAITGTTPPPAPPRAIFQTPETDAALQPLADGIGVINSITALAHWDTQSDLGRLSTLVNLYTSFDKLAGDKLPGDLGQFGGYLSLGISLQNGDGLGVVSSINTIGNGVVDNAINSALGSSGVPYVSTLMAFNNFEAHPGQSLGTIIGSFWGPAGSVMGSAIGGMLDSIFGGGSPPPPEGIVHYALDENGAVQVQVETNTSGGAAPASQVAGQLLGVLQGVVDQQNAADANANPGDNLSIDPSRLPRVGFDHEHTWIELTRPDGSIVREAIDPSTIGQRMLQVALDNDALVPQWQIQTTLAHAQAPTPQPSAASDSGSHNDTVTPHATPSTAPSAAPVHAVQGHASEAADHKTQTYGTLVVHLSPEHSAAVQANIEAITEQANDKNHANTNGQSVYRDADNDGYFEATEWVDALDDAGKAQGLLVLDRNHDNVIATADILHLGSNGQAESNSMAWLDANGDGKLDASDPAFAAIKVWTDINRDGRVDEGEQHSLQSLSLSSIDFANGQINYSNGQSDALTATTLKADTEGMKAIALTEVGEDGKLHTVANAGQVLVHEGYEGKVLVDGKGNILQDGQEGVAGAHWVDKRVNSYDHIATRTGDWEGTEDQALHRHGEGGNAEGSPTETWATGATSKGAVLGKENVTTTTTMGVGDKRITSDVPSALTATNKPTGTTITLNAGDARIVSNTPIPKPVVLVPSAAGTLGEDDADEDGWIHIPNDGLFGKGGVNAALSAVALGAVQTTAYAIPDSAEAGFAWQTADPGPGASPSGSGTPALPVGEGGTAALQSGSTIALENFAVVHQLRLGVVAPIAHTQPSVSTLPQIAPNNFAITTDPILIPVYRGNASTSALATPDGFISTTPATLYIAPGNGGTTTPQIAPSNPNTGTPGNDTTTAPSDSTPTNPGVSVTPPTAPIAPTPQAPIDTTPTAPTPSSATTANDLLSDPQEEAELHVSVATLLANDTNAVGIAQVGNAQHGTVTLSGSEVIFTPEANYHGPASFAYVVTGQDGGRAAGVASFTITAVNDVPIAADEAANASEDAPLTITQAMLLANDTDVDVATDSQTLRVSAVGHAQNGTVSVLGDGSILFTPDANFHGVGSFEYVVSDGNGGSAIATATVQVAAVNDVPDALGETIASAEDTTLVLTPAALLANDTDPDVATDGQTLSISAVSNAAHGTVSLLGNGSVQFVPDANYTGTATFDYVVSDGNGGTATAVATVLVGSTDDAPVASGETVSSQEDQAVTLTAAALLANETDVDNATSSLSISRVATGAGGSVTLNASGNVVFTPTANFSGTASFTYWVKDPDGLESNAATVTLNVAPVNDSPYAQGESVFGASEDAVFTINKSILLANDGDAEDGGSQLGIELVGNASAGTGSVALDGGGNVVYTPTANFNGTTTFQYQVRDTSGALSPAVSANIVVAAVNDLPIGVDDQFQTFSDLPTLHSHATIGFNQLVGNDLDADNDPLTVSAVRNATNGTVAIVSGAVSFTPALSFSGLATFEYQVDDQHGGTTWATAYVTVKEPPNGYPTMSVVSVNHSSTWDGGGAQLVSTATHIAVSPADDGGTGLMSITYLNGSYTARDRINGTLYAPVALSTPNYSLTDADININYQVAAWYNSEILLDLDSFETSWRVVDDRGLANTWHFSYRPTTGYTSSMDFTGYVPPVVLGLDGGSPHYIETQYSNVRYDLNGDGVADQVAWAAPGSGVLGIDLNGDHQISNANEFAFSHYVPGAKTDLEGLRAFDSNHNGVLDAGDAQWAKFGVWEDKNSDGVTQDGEYQTLDVLGIANINLNGHAPTQAQDKPADGHLTGVAVVGESSFTRTDGSTGQVDDAMLAFGVAPTVAPHSHEAEVMRMALLFNQMCNTASDGDHAALGYVPIQTEGHWQDAVVAVPQGVWQETQPT